MRLLLAILCSIAPFVAGAIAALSVRHDVRMLWMALAATIVARLLRHLTRPLLGMGGVTVTVVTATLAAAAVAIVLGARGVFGVVAVAVVLAGFATAGAFLSMTPRKAPQSSP